MSKTKEHAKNIPDAEERRRTYIFRYCTEDGNNLLPSADRSPIVLCMYNFVFSSQLTKGIYASGWFVQMANNKCTPSFNNYV